MLCVLYTTMVCCASSSTLKKKLEKDAWQQTSFYAGNSLLIPVEPLSGHVHKSNRKDFS